jgi:hypothetical protein
MSEAGSPLERGWGCVEIRIICVIRGKPETLNFKPETKNSEPGTTF